MQEKRLKLAVVGAGHWGPNLIRGFHSHPDSAVTWVSDKDRVRLAAIQERYAGVSVSDDWESVVSRPDVDAVVVTTPTASHYAIAKRALEEGKHVLVEKPMATRYDEAMELVQIAERKRLKLMVGHVFLFNPAVRRIKEVLLRKELGDIFYLYSTRTNLGPIRADVNALWDLAAHDISILLYLLEVPPLKVHGFGSSFINPPLEDVVFAGLHFPKGVVANLHVSWLDPKKVRQLVIVGSRKMLVFDDMATAGDSVRIFDKNVSDTLSEVVINDTLHDFRRSVFEGKMTSLEVPPAEPLKNECQAFIEWILGDVPQPSTGRFGAEVVRWLEQVSFAVRETAGTSPSEGVMGRPVWPSDLAIERMTI